MAEDLKQAGVTVFVVCRDSVNKLPQTDEPFLVLSDEPGFYLPGAYGIRLENLLLVQPADFPESKKPFLRFEVLTLAPFDRRLIEPKLLDPQELAWLDAYHARVLDVIGPSLDGPARQWLERACERLAG